MGAVAPAGRDERAALADLARRLRSAHTGDIDDAARDSAVARHRAVGAQIDYRVRKERERRPQREWKALQEHLDRLASDGPTVHRTHTPGHATAEPSDHDLAARWRAERDELRRWLRQRTARAAAPSPPPLIRPRPWLAWEVDLPEFWSPAPVLAFRVWDVRPAGLFGAFKAWTTPTYEAGCVLADHEIRDDTVPHTNGWCHHPPCGVYALKDPPHLPEGWAASGRSTHGIIAHGLVELSGKVVEHELGYRAARATAVAVIVSLGDRLVPFVGRPPIERLFSDPPAALAAPGSGTRLKGPRHQQIVADFLQEHRLLYEATRDIRA